MLNRTTFRSRSKRNNNMLVICAQSAEPGASCLDIKFLNRQGECKRVSCVMMPGSGTWLVSLRGNSKGLCDGRSIVCGGASGISLKGSKLSSFVTSVGG
jgi:hypothetical protein